MIPGKMCRGALAVGSVQAVGGGPLLRLVLGLVLGLVLVLVLVLVYMLVLAVVAHRAPLSPFSVT